jgi:hypothetical protein
MISFPALKSVGTTNERLKEVFTAVPPNDNDVMPDEVRERRKKDCELRKKFQDRINNRLMENINFALKNYQFYSAVDLAWEPPPIAKKIHPLVLYAQNRIDIQSCASQLTALGCAPEFVKKDDKGNITGIDMPRFFDVSVNLVRSLITRRLAAQSNKYNNLFPYFKYEARSTSQVGKLRADIMSQRADIMADQFGYRHHDTQVDRDMMMYSRCIDFVRCAWEKDKAFREVPKAPGDQSDPTFDTAVTREGLAWINPHPSRVFWDNAYPLATLNDDTGCTYCGFWDVTRFGNIDTEPRYWNRREVGYNSAYLSLFSTYAGYFSQYYTTISPPQASSFNDATSGNDRLNNLGFYSGEMKDTSVVLANYYEKLVPSDWGFGGYPHELWIRFIVAGWDTVVYAEILPSTPGAAAEFNCRDDRQLNLGIGHELLSYQDHMTNLTSYLLLALNSDNHKILVVDIDLLTAEQLADFRKRAQGKNWRSETHILEVSRKKLEELGLKVEDVVKLVETRSSTQIQLVFEAMLRLMSLVERMMALSPQEQGQPAPREISATETNLIAGTTESVYNFISDAIDEFRAAKKRIIYESLMAFGDPKMRVPIIGRYSRETVKAAGFELEDIDEQSSDPRYTGTIIGDKKSLVHDYIFTSRDGAERATNQQAAQVLTEALKSILAIPAVQEALTRNRLFGILNEYFRLAGAFDLKLDDEDPKGNEPIAPAASEVYQQAMEQVTSTLEEHSKQLAAIAQALAKAGVGGAPGGNGGGAAPVMPMMPPPALPMRR